jgi:peptidoglycan/xylan/chitin deacetylase (PgdA/CDA1 family)
MSIEDLFCTVAALVPTRRETGSVVVLCYHRLDDHLDGSPLDRFTISPELFVRHLSIIHDSGLNVIGPDEFWTVEGPAIMITFDDNLVSHVRHALPILNDYGAKATFFLNPAELDQPGLLTFDDVESLLSAGMWIGAHSDNLRVVSLFASDEFERKVAKYREFLESLGMPLTWAYPGGYIGSFDSKHDEILTRCGFNLRFSTLEKPAENRNPRSVQGRYVIRKNCTNRYFRSALAGGLQLLRWYKVARAKILPISRAKNGVIGSAGSVS